MSLPATTGIIGSKHDLSQATGGGYWAGEEPNNQVCIYCHTPHHASTTQLPLWNRTESVETFAPYSSPTFEGENYFADPLGHQPQAESKLCLSCHDGAIDASADGSVTEASTSVTCSRGYTSTVPQRSFSSTTVRSVAIDANFTTVTVC